MKRLLAIAIFFVIGIVFADRFVTQKIAAQTPATNKPGGLCYAQCGAYKFYWHGDFCYDMIATNCTASFSLKDVVSMLKSIRSAFMTGKLTEIVDVKPIFTAWLICKPLIQDCVAPQLADCETTCQQDPTFYAPNLTVGSNWGGSFQGLYYDDAKKTLSMRVVNTGLGYASDIGVRLITSQTTSQDDTTMVASTTMTDTIPELLFFGSRQAAPKTVSDTVTDFLIDQSRFHTWLSQYKSDAKNVYIPPGWDKTISVDAPNGALTRFTLTVDPESQIIESYESDNTYVLDVDKRPKPPGFSITDIKVVRNENSLTDYTVTFTIKNSGDLEGDAHLSIYKGITTTGDTVATATTHVSAHATATVQQTMTLDVSRGSAICATLENYAAVVADDKGKTTTTPNNFSVPFYAGAVSGQITDKAGKPVVGATITTSTGLTTTSGDSGYYHLWGISTLGTMTLTFEHPNYTQKITKDVELSLSHTNAIGGCDVSGLSQRVDVTMRDQPLVLHVRLKSTPGPLVNGKVIFIGGAGSFPFDVPGQKNISEMEPGQFRVTAMAPGYVTKDVEVVLTPPEQTIDITLEPLWGRPTDDGLSLTTPVKLWEKTIANGKIDTIAGSKNGKLLVVDTNDSTNRSGPAHWTGTLTFLNPIDGTSIKSVTVPFNVGQSQVALASSYDGRTVGFTYSIPDPVEKTRSETFVKLFNAAGSELGTKDLGKSLAVMSAVSPDGFFFYPFRLMNSSLYTYTRQEMQGKGGTDPMMYSSNGDLHFLRNGNVVAGCKNGRCVVTLAGDEVRGLGNIHQGGVIDSSFDDGTIIIRGKDTLYYIGANSWNKEVESAAGFKSAAVSPGGEYTIVAKGPSGSNTLSVFDRTGKDVTPKFNYGDVRYVEANDRGIFFSAVRSNKLTYYQLGQYATEYKPPSVTTEQQTESPDFEQWVGNGNKFESIPSFSWDMFRSMMSMVRAKKNVTLTTTWGTITFGEGTIFARNYLSGGNSELILMWGQVDIEATSPQKILVFRHKLYEPDKFHWELQTLGNMTPNDYVTVENLHTIYSVRATKGAVSVTVTRGDVTVSSAGKKQDVHAGQIAQMTDSGSITVCTNWTRYFPWVLVVFIILIIGVVGIIKMKNKKKGGI